VKILIVTDAWKPQVNGVVRTLENVRRELLAMGHDVRLATAEGHRTVPLPTYREIRLAVLPRRKLRAGIEQFAPDALHIATEGPLGVAARRICLKRQIPFTTSLTTRFPEYLQLRMPILRPRLIYAALRAFHAPAHITMVSTHLFMRELQSRGFDKVRLWSRGVDAEHFRPLANVDSTVIGLQLRRPVFLYVGRVAAEKNIQAFLSLELPGTKLIVGDGPQRAQLQRRYPDAVFTGHKTGDELIGCYNAADVFVFPSRTDTYGLAMLEALACGVPVAAFPVQAPLAVIDGTGAGCLHEDLRAACMRALAIPRQLCREMALQHSWRTSAEQFIGNLAVFG
jgi:glycosyltransferase involved in cell wall biosynthesis